MASTIKVDKIAQASGSPEFTIPTADGSANQFLKTDGNGVLSFDTVTTTALTGSTNTWIPTITGADALTGTANFTYDGNVLDVKNSGTASSINLYCESSNAHYIKLKSGPHASATSYTLTLPNAPPSVSGQSLTATDAGVASWATISSYTNPNTVSGCLATLSANQSIAGSSYVKIALDTEVWDLDNEFASNKFTVKTAGRYFIIVQTHMADMGTDKKLQNFIYKNGTDVCNARSNTSSAGHLTAMTANVLELAVDDYIESYVYNGDGTARNASNSVGTYMMIQRIT